MEIKNLISAAYFGKKNTAQPGFGTFFGVYLPGILSMFGVIIYLRFGWIIGSLGLFKTVAIVALSCFIVFVTVLSIASAATNMHVGGGGTYYMVSRSLGIEIGSAIGIPLFIAQAFAISFCTVGFSESIHPFFPNIPLHYLGAATLIILMILAYTSASIALKTQFLIFLIILGSLASLFLGHSISVEETTEVLNDVFSTPFWAGFALFFPAATGVESGVSMSGNLRSPKKSLPMGTIAVLITGSLVYLSIPFFMWSHVPRHVLVSDALIFQHIARFQFLIIIGIWAATLSSILSGLLAAPRTLQALAQDKVLPSFLAKEWGKNKEPRAATLFCFAIAVVGVFYGSIDIIAPILTMFYLIAYATLNLATGLEELLRNPSWRPTFRVHWTISILGVILCLLAMFMIDAGATFIALFFIITFYTFMKKRNFAKKWEDIWNGFLFFLSRFAIYRLSQKQPSPRAWRPNFLVLSDSLMPISHLVNITTAIGGGKGFLTLASIFSPGMIDHDRAERWKKIVTSHLSEHKIEALIEFSIDDSFQTGAKNLLTNYGVGTISPNTLVLGEMKKREAVREYIEIIQTACLAKKNVIIFRDTVLESLKEIHIWWDDSSKQNSKLMLLLGHMLKSNKNYKKAEVYLNSIVATEAGKIQRLKYFDNLLTRGRFLAVPQIYLKEPDLSVWELMAKSSSNADLVFIGMNPPIEDLDAFEEYYYTVTEAVSNIPNAVFAISSEPPDFLKEIFN